MLLIMFIVSVFATYRAAQLFAYDEGPGDILVQFRSWVHRDKTGQCRQSPFWVSFDKLVNCPYCLGVWFAMVFTCLSVLVIPMTVWMGLIYWWGVAGGQTFLQSINDVSRVGR